MTHDLVSESVKDAHRSWQADEEEKEQEGEALHLVPNWMRVKVAIYDEKGDVIKYFYKSTYCFLFVYLFNSSSSLVFFQVHLGVHLHPPLGLLSRHCRLFQSQSRQDQGGEERSWG